MNLEQLRSFPPYQVPNDRREALLLEGLEELTQHHYSACDPYRRIVDGLWAGNGRPAATRLEDIPYLPVSLFKKMTLASVDDQDITTTLTSSGTTGQAVSKIPIDKLTSTQQQLSLAQSVSSVLGKKRLPMLIVDTPAVFKNPALMSARGAGVLGMMRYGYKPVFILDDDGNPNVDAVQGFLDEYGASPFFIFGFTFMVWAELYTRFKELGLNLSNGILLHSGGWKKMEDMSVNAATFRELLAESFGLVEIRNFYGMVEQLGSIYIEGDDGLLYPPNFSDVIIRDAKTWEPCPIGKEGLIQVLSLVPRSYPGHSLLTEDVGVIESVSSAGRFHGHGLRILGRVKKSELRGCSDVIGAEQGL